MAGFFIKLPQTKPIPMKKLFLLLLFATNLVCGGNIFTYKLPEKEKLEGTYSASISGGQTVHFTLSKNTDTKQHILTPFVLASDNKVKQLNPFVAKNEFNILSYHSRGNVMTIMDYNTKSKELSIIDFDLVSGESKSVKQPIVDSPDNLFRLEDKTVMVFFDNKSKSFVVKSITDSEHIADSKVDVPKENVKSFGKLLGQTPPDAINQQEYVENGSILKTKGYYNNGNLIYTLTNSKDTEIMRVDLMKNEFSHTRIVPEFMEGTKDISNFYYDNKMVYLFVEPTDLRLTVYDAADGKPLKNLSLTKDFKDKITGEMYDEYRKATSKLSIISTVAANRTKSGKMNVRLGNVNENEYRYAYNWWFNDWFAIHMMMMQQQQMQMMQMNRGFGPAPEEIAIMKEKKKYASIDVCLDANLNVADNEETVYKNIDKLSYNEKYGDQKYIKEYTSEFTDSQLHYIYQDSKTKEVVIAFENL